MKLNMCIMCLHKMRYLLTYGRTLLYMFLLRKRRGSLFNVSMTWHLTSPLIHLESSQKNEGETSHTVSWISYMTYFNLTSLFSYTLLSVVKTTIDISLFRLFLIIGTRLYILRHTLCTKVGQNMD